MSTRAGTPIARGVLAEDWVAGVLSGLLAGALAGGLLAVGGAEAGRVIPEAIPASYGLGAPAPFVGWVLHLIHSALLGVGYAGVARAAPVDAVHRLRTGAVVGAGYGIALWIAVGTVVVPTAVSGLGYVAASTTAHLGAAPGYAGFGVAVGVVYAALLIRPALGP